MNAGVGHTCASDALHHRQVTSKEIGELADETVMQPPLSGLHIHIGVKQMKQMQRFVSEL
jgi:hypothetical protein